MRNLRRPTRRENRHSGGCRREPGLTETVLSDVPQALVRPGLNTRHPSHRYAARFQEPLVSTVTTSLSGPAVALDVRQCLDAGTFHPQSSARPSFASGGQPEVTRAGRHSPSARSIRERRRSLSRAFAPTSRAPTARRQTPDRTTLPASGSPRRRSSCAARPASGSRPRSSRTSGSGEPRRPRW